MCMGYFSKVDMGGLTQHSALFVRPEYLRSVDIPPAKARLNLRVVMAADGYLYSVG